MNLWAWELIPDTNTTTVEYYLNDIYFRCEQEILNLLPPANEVCEGYVFTGVCLYTGGACVVVGGGMHGEEGHAWRGVVACIVKGGCAWQRGACVAKGGMCGKGGVHGKRGACVVKGACMAKGGGMRDEGRHAWRRGACVGYDEIRSMSGQYASHWNAFLLIMWKINFGH